MDSARQLPTTEAAASTTAGQTQRQRPPPGSKRIEVLAIDVNQINQIVLHKILSRCGFTVYITSTCNEGLDYLRQSTFYFPHSRGTVGSRTSAAEEKNQQDAPPQPRLQIDIIVISAHCADSLAFVRTIRGWEDEGKLVRHAPVLVDLGILIDREGVGRFREAGADRIESFRAASAGRIAACVEELAVKYPGPTEKERKEEEVVVVV